MSWKCKKCDEVNDDLHTDCWKCVIEVESELTSESRSPTSQVPCSTTPEIPCREIRESKGIVAGEVILGANILRDLAAGITNIIGGRSGIYESKLKEGRNQAISEMVRDAQAQGADAVIGVDVDYEFMGGMLIICASGTAVCLVEEE